MNTTSTWKPTEKQVQFVKTLLEERVPLSERPEWLYWIRKEVHSNARLNEAITALRAKPLLQVARPTEEGLYRNPETGELFRVTKQNWSLLVAKYSHTGARRLTTSGEEVKKGTWKRFNSWQSRQVLATLQADWKMSEQDMVEYRYGICLFCYRGLRDAESVCRNYGPECAKQNSLPWGKTK